MDWRHIPSLFSLRAFEALARHGSLSAAARDLNITHAAVSQHLKKLEEELGLPLARREGRGIALTPDGHALAQGLSEGFGQIADTLAALTNAASARPLRVTVTPSFAEYWLMPRLGDFWKKHPEVPLSLVPSEEVVDMTRGAFDLALRYGRGDWPGVSATQIMPSRFQVAAAKDLCIDGPLTEQTWLFLNSETDTKHWAEQNGFIAADTEIKTFETRSLVASAFSAGLGLIVGSSATLDTKVKEGRAQILADDCCDDAGYWVALPERRQTPAARVFKAWILDQAKQATLDRLPANP